MSFLQEQAGPKWFWPRQKPSISACLQPQIQLAKFTNVLLRRENELACDQELEEYKKAELQ